MNCRTSAIFNCSSAWKRFSTRPAYQRPVPTPVPKAITARVEIAALASVDLVTWFDEDTPLQLIEALRPDVLVKGGDYDMATLPETQAMARWGGTALAIPFVSGFSTTALVQKIRQNR